MKHISKDETPVTKTNLQEVLKDYPTKKDLQKVLQNYPTKKDLQKTLQDYPTKKYLDERLTKFQKAFHVEMDHKFLVMEERLDRRIDHFTNKILTAIDPLIKDMELRQQERELATMQNKQVTDDIVDLQKRVTKLEHV